MGVHSLTVDLSDDAFRSVSSAERKRKLSPETIVAEALSAASPILNDSSNSANASFRAALTQMAYLSDAHLFQAARASMPGNLRERLAFLNDQAQREGLKKTEEVEREKLLTLYRETILVRAQAAVLLKQRNYTVSDPSQFESDVFQ